jgi:DNA polymerase III delta subunit
MLAAMVESRLDLIVGSSIRLRDELLAETLKAWAGPVKRLVEPADLQRILLDLETPSFLDEAALTVLRCDDKYLQKHQGLLLDSVGKPRANGWLLLVAPGIDQRGKLAKALTTAKALHVAESPDPRELQGWLFQRLSQLPWGVERPGEVADELIAHVGDDPDALLSVLDVAVLYCAGQPVSAEAVRALTDGAAERPIWEFTGALLEGRAGKAIELMHAGGGIRAEQAALALENEARKLIACCETSDDAEATEWAGGRGRPNLYYARKRAKELGKATLTRLLQGLVLTHRQLRQSGIDPETALELLAVNAQRVVKAGR